MTRPPNPKGEIQPAGGGREGAPYALWRCPQCGHWGGITYAQLHGQDSCDHTNCTCGCTFHERRDWFRSADGGESAVGFSSGD